MSLNEEEIDFIYNGGHPDRNENFSNITYVYINPQVESICDYAFHGWKSLRVVIIPSSSILKHIGIGAFEDCESLELIHLPTSIETISAYAFRYCISLKSMHIPPLVKKIEAYCFQWCESLVKLIIPDACTCIEEYSFYDCSSLVSVQLPPALERLEEGAFESCESIIILSIPASVRYMGVDTFQDCISLQIVYIPSCVFDGIHNIFGTMNASSILLLTDGSPATVENGVICTDYPPTIVTLAHIQECLDEMPVSISSPKASGGLHVQSYNINSNQNPLDTLDDILQSKHPQIAKRLEDYSGMNLLHLLVYFSRSTCSQNSTYKAMSTLLTKCPQATLAVDSTGKTPLHHAVIYTQHQMNIHDFNLLLECTPLQVVHRAIESTSSRWKDEVQKIVGVKLDALMEQDEKSGLLPFMLAGIAKEQCDEDGFDVTSATTPVLTYTTTIDCPNHDSLDAIYEMLSWRPDVLKMYDIPDCIPDQPTTSTSSTPDDVNMEVENNGNIRKINMHGGFNSFLGLHQDIWNAKRRRLILE